MRQVRGEGFSVRFKRRPIAAKKKNVPLKKNVPVSIRHLFAQQAEATYPKMPILNAPANGPVSAAKPEISQAQKRLWIGAFKGDLRAIRMAVMAGADIEARDHEDRTAINIASQQGHIEALKTLLAAKEMKRMAIAGDLPDTDFFRKFGTKKRFGTRKAGR